MRAVRAGFFAFTNVPEHARAAYDAWHRLDHLPEQYAIDGIALGQRWAAVAPGPVLADFCTLYLVADPVEATLAEFRGLAAELRAAGRFFEDREAIAFGALHVEQRAAAPRVLVRPDVVPWRPHSGVHVLLDDPAAPEALVALDGVAGAWSFARGPDLTHATWRMPYDRITVCWLDGDAPGLGAGSPYAGFGFSAAVR